jgi:drug/metabolite transporter (DMT)-like permease
MLAAVLALGAAAAWGTGDFLGGLASRRAHVLVVLLVSQAVGLAGLTAWLLVVREPVPAALGLLAALGAGVAGVVGLACLYRGMAIGAMGVVAPISAASPLVPLAFDVARGTPPTAVQLSGIGLALVGITLVAREPGRGGRRASAGVGLAVAAALTFGLFFVGLDVAADESVPWATFAARAAAVVAVAIAVAARAAPALLPTIRPLLPLAVGVGLFDTGANVLLAIATTHGLVSAVALLGSLYPVATILLARLVLHERLAAVRRVGAVAALTGAALVAAG